MHRRFVAAMIAFAALAILAGFTLDGTIRLGTWLVLGAVALKTLLAHLKQGMD
jgi:hypothetical protein